MAFIDSKFGKFHYFQHDTIGNTIAVGEFFYSHYRPYMEALKEGDVLVDVGANIGFFTIYCALRGAHVEAFEASLEVFNLLQQNVSVNGLEEKVNIWNIALYDYEGRLGINPEWIDWTKRDDGSINYEAMGNSGGLSLIPSSTGTWESRQLDSFLLDKVNLIKVDTQGSDLRVLYGAVETIQKCRPVLCFEFEHNGFGKNAAGDSLEDFQAFMKEIGYEMNYVGGNGHTWQDFVAKPIEKD